MATNAPCLGVGMLCLLSVAACGRREESAKPPERATTGTAGSDGATGGVANGAPAPTGSFGEDLRYEMATNIEMVPYCLPYPVSYLVEDVGERSARGHKVFVRRRSGVANGVEPSRMELSGTCGPRKLEELYADDKRSISAEVPGVAFTVSTLRADSYALSWRTGGRIHYGKLWASSTEPGCFVRAMFEYDASEQPVFAKIIAKVAAANPACGQAAP